MTIMPIKHIIYIMSIIFKRNCLLWLAVLSDDEPGPSNHDLPILPDDRSQFDVHCALEDDKVKKFRIHCQYI